MTFEEKVQSILDKRTIALISKKGALQSEVDANGEKDFNNIYLFGDGTNEGVVNFFESYYRELNLAVGRTTSSPSLQGGIGTSQSAYLARFITAVDLNGDDATGFYPPDAYNIGAQDLNYSSIWFTTNGDQGQTTGGIVGLGSSLTSATTNLYNKRQEDLTGPTPPDYFPDGLPDNPDYYDNPYRSNLLTAFTNLISGLNNYKTYLGTTITLLTKVQDDQNELVNITNSKLDYPLSDISIMESLQLTIQDHIDDVTDEYNYFNSFSASNNISGQPGYNRTTFNTKLTSTLPSLTSGIGSTLTTRESQVKTALSYNSLSSGIRKWLIFWITQNIEKPIAPYVTLNGITGALNNAEKSITSSDNALNILYGDPTRYITTPRTLATYFDPTLDVDGLIIENKITYLWLGTPIANKYKIYRRSIVDTTVLNNDAWTDLDLLTWTITVNPETNNIDIEHIDDSVLSDTLYSYRAQIFDTDEGPSSPLNRLDSFNSSSLQSRIYDEDGYSVVSILDGEIDVGIEHGIVSGTFVYIKDSFGADGIYQVIDISDTKIYIENSVVSSNTGTVHKTFGIMKYTLTV